MNSFPLVFTFRDLIAGQGFIASIETRGRLILAKEPEGFTFYGVNPAGLSGGAEDRAAAFADLRRTYQEVLDDIAHDTRDFEEFKASVEAFVSETNDDAAAEWEALRARVRAGELACDIVERRETGDCTPRVEVRRVEPTPAPRAASPTPDLNTSQGEYARAA